MHYTRQYTSPLGEITIACNEDHLIGLWFEDQKYFASTLSDHSPKNELPVLEETSRWLDLYFSGQIPDFTPRLSLKGTPFQMAVWDILLQIPYGKTISYKDIALQIAWQRGLETMSSQAIGGAVGRNPISLIVPCHRVIGSNGSLTGYAGGLSKKSVLLAIEEGDLSSIGREKEKREAIK